MNWTEKDVQDYAAKMGSVQPGRMVKLLGPGTKPKTKMSKHRAVKTECEGILFDSKLEALCWGGLRLREKMGEIRGLRRQVRFSLFGNGGEHIGIYTADFVFEEYLPAGKPFHNTAYQWQRVVADAKSSHTRTLAAWARTKKMLLACHGFDVLELP